MAFLISRRLAVCGAWALLGLLSVRAGSEVVQEIPLQAGWNAVWLEVTPAYPSPQAVFGGTPVDQAAAYYPVLSTVQFVTDPGEIRWNNPGWAVWYAPAQPEAALSNLSAVDAGRAYLLHALAPARLTVRGEAVFTRLRWLANSLNLVGLPVDPEAPLTFGEFFGSSPAHASLRVYRLTEGTWRPLVSPGTVPIARGVAYWVYCTGRSDWQGPLDLSLGSSTGVDFGTAISWTEWRVVNRSDAPQTPLLGRVCGDLPLCTQQLEPGTLAAAYPPLDSVQSLGEISAGAAVTVRLQVRREQMSEARQGAVLSVRGGGCLHCVPVTASRGVP